MNSVYRRKEIATEISSLGRFSDALNMLPDSTRMLGCELR